MHFTSGLRRDRRSMFLTRYGVWRRRMFTEISASRSGFMRQEKWLGMSW